MRHSMSTSKNHNRTLNNDCVYDYGGSISKSKKSLKPALQTFKAIQAQNIEPKKAEGTRYHGMSKGAIHNPKILSIACGYGEDAPIYRSVFGEACLTVGIDISPKFKRMAETEQQMGEPTRYCIQDATQLACNVDTDFTLIVMRHPEPASNQKIWTAIFIEAALLSRKTGAPILMTTFAKNERAFFIDLSKISNKLGIELTDSWTNPAADENRDGADNIWGRDRYIALFKPKMSL